MMRRSKKSESTTRLVELTQSALFQISASQARYKVMKIRSSRVGFKPGYLPLG